MGLGLVSAAGVQGGYEELERILAQRIAQKVYEDEQAQKQQENAFRRRQIEQGDRRLNLEEEQLRAPKPEAPERPYVVGGSLVTPQGGVLYSAPEKPAPPQRPMTVSPGASLVDPETGRIITSVPDRPQAQPKPEASLADKLQEYEERKKIDAKYTGARPSLGTERNTLNYFNRMLEAERNARAVEGQIGDRDAALSGGIPLLPNFVENFLKTDAGQKYTQAQRMFTEARLRKESGAAIPTSEYENDRRTNFRDVGDKPETLKQKRASRLQTMRGIGNASGRALQEFYGDDASLDSILKEFMDEQPGAPAAGSGPRVGELRTINGQKAYWDGKGWLPVR